MSVPCDLFGVPPLGGPVRVILSVYRDLTRGRPKGGLQTSSSFVSVRLPWLIGAAALGVYLITLNHWVSLHSLENVARASGWLWRPQLDQPLNAVLLFPFRLLP